MNKSARDRRIQVTQASKPNSAQLDLEETFLQLTKRGLHLGLKDAKINHTVRIGALFKHDCIWKKHLKLIDSESSYVRMENDTFFICRISMEDLECRTLKIHYTFKQSHRLHTFRLSKVSKWPFSGIKQREKGWSKRVNIAYCSIVNEAKHLINGR